MDRCSNTKLRDASISSKNGIIQTSEKSKVEEKDEQVLSLIKVASTKDIRLQTSLEDIKNLAKLFQMCAFLNSSLTRTSN